MLRLRRFFRFSPGSLLGWFIVLFQPIRVAIQWIGDLDTVNTYWPWVLAFLSTGEGVFLTTAGGLVLLGVGAYYYDEGADTGARTKSTSARRLTNPRKRQRLARTLATYRNEYSRVRIIHHAIQDRPMAERMRDVFSHANWIVNFNNLAQDTAQRFGQPKFGVEIHGRSRHLVDAVYHAMLAAGVYDAKPDYAEGDFKPEHQNDVMNNIQITIGNEEV